MAFKRPVLKRISDNQRSFESPEIKKKTKSSLLSATIASPEVRDKAINHFDDNFSQFFHSQHFRTQFTQQNSINKSKQNENTRDEKEIEFGHYNFTQTGLSQILISSQFEKSILCKPHFQSAKDLVTTTTTKPEENLNQQFFTQCLKTPNANNDDEEPEIIENEDDLVESSQMFLHGVSALQLDITAMIDETLCANKINEIVELDSSEDKFNVYNNNTICSQYLELKRLDEKYQRHEPSDMNQGIVRMNTVEILERVHVFAKFAVDDEADGEEADISDQLNECIDSDSSALCALLDDIDDDDKTSNEIEKQQTNPNEAHSSRYQLENQENNVINPYKPVSSAKFCKLGPFFGLPEKVKRLIKEYKRIDDLYGM